jgi:hypothetical protein
MSEVNPSTHLLFEPFRDCTDRGLAFEMHPIVWNGVEFNSWKTISWKSC